MKRALLFVCTCFTGLAIYGQVPGLPEGFNTTAATNPSEWIEPVGAVFSKDGFQLFVWEKAGLVYVNNRFDQGNGNSIYNRQSVPVIDIRDEVGNWSDMGLLGFALDPGFTTGNGGYIYLYYIVDRHHLLTDGDSEKGYDPDTNDYFSATIGRITRYNTTVSGGILSADLTSRKILLGESKTTGVPILHRSHSIGSLAFAADGTLLATTGDGASYTGTDVGDSTNDKPLYNTNTYYADALADGIITNAENVGAFRSQLLSSLSGKLLRINREDGNGIPSNPFFDEAAPRSARSRIWALGFRNPFRMSVKPGAGSLLPAAGDIGEVFVGDVGYGLSEELNIVKAPGQNFGWPIFEGNGPSAKPNEIYWGEYAMTTRNKDELRPMCGGRDTLFFHELIRQDNAAKNSDIFSSCSGELIRSGIRYIHARPALDWAHADGNVFVSRFNSQGEAIWPRVGTPESGVSTDTTTFKGNASTGGIWYTGAGNTFPPEFKDKFLVSDFGGRWIRRIGIEFSDVVTSVNNFFINTDGEAGGRDGAIVSMAENPIDGSLVYVCIGLEHYGSSSAVRKIIYGGNVPPVAVIKADQYYSATSTLKVNFIGSDSYDQNGDGIASYAWDFGDPTSPDNTSTDMNPIHEFNNTSGEPKQYIVKLIVIDDKGAQSEQVKFIVSLNNTPPVVTITSPENNSTYKVGPDTTYNLEADVTDDPTQVLTYAWQTTLVHNNHMHPGTIDPAAETAAVISRIGCNEDDYHWVITLKVSDDAGLSTSATSEIYPDCDAPLPLILRSFSVTQTSTTNLVKWTTELEENIEYFEVERSYDGVTFLSINRQEALNITGVSHYRYPDNDITPGLIYYRLKIVEQGSIIRYSVIVRTMSEGEDIALKVVPNPIIENFSVIYNSQRNDIVSVEVRDMAGRLLHTLKEKVNRGQNVIYLQNLPNWPAGVYTVAVKNNDVIKQTKFVKADKK